LKPSTRHAELGGEFYDVVEPARFPATILRWRNDRWAARVGLDGLSDAEWVAHFGRFEPLAGSFSQPLALRYHGHQFRSYNPDLGDGRGFLFAQLHDLADDRLLDLGTKGSGRTPWSRGGDGRLTLKGGVRELLATEMLEALGVDTSKTFSLIETGEELQRGDEPSPTRSAVLVRLNHSHIRIGSFQRQAALDDVDATRRLMDHAITTYMPSVWRDDLADRATAFLAEVSARVARTGAAWMAAGFVHGVLNTDNINVTGESFDYGPWRFLPTFDPAFTAAYFDHQGLYAYGRQPGTLLWNLIRLAECLLPFASQTALETALDLFRPAYDAALREATLRRLGLDSAGAEADQALVESFNGFLERSRVPYEQAMFDWRGGVLSAGRAAGGPAAEAYAAGNVAALFGAHAPAADANLDHPYFAARMPCTMLVDDVDALWAPIADHDDWSTLAEKLGRITAMSEAYGTQIG